MKLSHLKCKFRHKIFSEILEKIAGLGESEEGRDEEMESSTLSLDVLEN
jgi:hypothetical protein